MTTIEVPTPHGQARAHLHFAADPRAALVLGHGAGGGVSARDLVAVTGVAVARGVSVALVEQPYRVAGRRSPAPERQLDVAWTAVIEHLRADELRGLALLVGGRSMGARVACRTARATGAFGVLCLAFPLLPPRRRAAPAGSVPESRLPELDAVTVPTLVVQGARDPFGMPPDGPQRKVAQVEGDHSLRSDLPAVGAAVAGWLPTVLTSLAGHSARQPGAGAGRRSPRLKCHMAAARQADVICGGHASPPGWAWSRPGRRIAAIAALSGALCASLLAVSAARAIPGAGPHETVDVTTSTTQPNTSAGLGYSAVYHAAGDTHGDPPALRRLVIVLPPGTKADTSVPARCGASDAQLMLMGESACPPASRVGSGQATVKTSLGTTTYDTALYNAVDQQLELVESGGRVISVVHTYIHGNTLDGPVPTCLTGGQPPSGCPVDQVTLLSNHLASVPISVGSGAAKRSYGITPPSCPRSGSWQSHVTLYYADGSVDTVVSQAPCTQPAQARQQPASRPGARHRHRQARRHRTRARRRAPDDSEQAESTRGRVGSHSAA